MTNPIRNIGILAHVDAGKTSLTENFLYLSGAIKSKGNVDKGNTITDSLSIEKQRGISIKSASESFLWKDHQINLIDTPRHTDFSSEVERILPVLDLAIIVISSVEGIQSNTVILTESLIKLGIPFIIFINKIDRIGSDFNQLIIDVEKAFSCKTFQLNNCLNEASNEVEVYDLWKGLELSDNDKKVKDTFIEKLADLDEGILERYLDGTIISDKLILEKAVSAINKGALIPIFLGSAKFGQGINGILNACISFFETSTISNTELSAFCYRIEFHRKFGKLAHIKIISGQLKNRDRIYNLSQQKDQKVAQIWKYRLGKLIDCDRILAGDIGIVSGLDSVKVGDEFGIKTKKREFILSNPVLNIRIRPKNPADYVQLKDILQKLWFEDPNLNFKWFREDQEMHLNLMGAIQKEILQDLILEEHNIETIFEEPTIIYKETPLKPAEGSVRYWMPKPCWAIMKFRIEPGKLGSGVIFESNVGINDIKQKFQNEVDRCIPQAVEQGIKGWEVTDLKIILIEGEDHEIHSRPGDFNLATPMGLMRALQNSGTQFLEPLIQFEIITHESHLGALTSELLSLRAKLDNPTFSEETITLKGKVPVATSLDLSIKLNMITGGKFKFLQRSCGYEPCENRYGKIRAHKGVSPLDENKWILHKRGAYRADELK